MAASEAPPAFDAADEEATAGQYCSVALGRLLWLAKTAGLGMKPGGMPVASFSYVPSMAMASPV